tara:strand:- start:5065 stop:5697 length:633 start_codon:yes stop_codon:yes gene_type:complete
MAYQYDDPAQRMAQAQQARKDSLGQLRGAVRARSAYTDDVRRQIERDIRKSEIEKKNELKRRNSNWLNWTLLGTAVGSTFGMPFLGAGLGTLFGGGKALASGGDPFDVGAQFEYLDPRMATGAAMGIGRGVQGAGSMGLSPATTAAMAVGVPGQTSQPTASGRSYDEGFSLREPFSTGADQLNLLDRQLQNREAQSLMERRRRNMELMGQ